MKTMPKAGDKLFTRNSLGESLHHTVESIDNYGMVQTTQGFNCHYSAFMGFVIKKPRKCEECAKPKGLVYIGHTYPNFKLVGTNIGTVCNSKEKVIKAWEYVSTLALVSTEEVEK